MLGREATPLEIVYAVFNPSPGGDALIREAAQKMSKMGAADRFLFMTAIKAAAEEIREIAEED